MEGLPEGSEMITIACTEAERDLIISRMDLDESDTRIPLFYNCKDPDKMIPIHFIIGTEIQTQMVGHVINRCLILGEKQ